MSFRVRGVRSFETQCRSDVVDAAVSATRPLGAAEAAVSVQQKNGCRRNDVPSDTRRRNRVHCVTAASKERRPRTLNNAAPGSRHCVRSVLAAPLREK
ncbi:MAG TPA: hypothetical protein VMN60_04450, partial [Longimicrobiales bacterium]|nr:hypothetical protein [Longimicrobiales bacterium]